MTLTALQNRYADDARFHAIVHTLLHMMEENNILPYEMRDAAYLAEYLFLQRRPINARIDKDGKLSFD